MTYQVTYDNIEFEVTGDLDMGYRETRSDPGIGPELEVTSILHDGVDLYDMLSEQVLNSIISSAKNLAREAQKEAV